MLFAYMMQYSRDISWIEITIILLFNNLVSNAMNNKLMTASYIMRNNSLSCDSRIAIVNSGVQIQKRSKERTNMRPHLVLTCVLTLLAVSVACAEPFVVVLPFDPIMDSLYTYYGKESILNYQPALQQILSTDLGKYQEIRVVESSDLDRYLKSAKINPDRWNDLSLAANIATALTADYAVIGTYGEFSRQIRVDARIVVAASAEVPPGYTASATVGLLEDIPSAAEAISSQIVPILTAAGSLRPTSKGVLFPEGEIAAYDPAGDTPPDKARLVVWVNTPAPAITADPSVAFARCERIDRMNIPAEQQRSQACQYALIPPGEVNLRIAQRGFLPYVDHIQLAPGKVYRLQVNLIPVEQMPR
ncbi:MAG: hypothetical protein PHI18_06880 [bacterium]|nr:hypothetical protein [bacterium]